MPTIVSRETLIRKIKETKGKFFSVTFIKRSNGQKRLMNARLGVKKFVKPDGKPRAISPGLITVYDLFVGKQDPENAYRCFGQESVISAKISGETYIVSENVVAEAT